MILLLLACAEPTFEQDIQPILRRSCAAGGCHLGPQEETGLDLSPSVAYAALVDQPSAQLPTMDRVAPGHPEESYLIYKLRGTAADVGGSGGTMPPGIGIVVEEIALFEAWIAAGARP